MAASLDIIIVIFENELRMLVKHSLETAGHRVFEFGMHREATLRLTDGLAPDFLVLDCDAARREPLEFQTLLTRASKEHLLLIGDAEQSFQQQVRALGVRHFVPKPDSPQGIEPMLSQLHLIVNHRLGEMEDGSFSWWALYTSYRHEKAVARMLQTKQFDVFLPLYQSVRRWSDRQKTLSLPLFPGYVFVRGGLERRLDVVTTPGVQMILFYGEQVAIIPDAEIDAIRRAIDGPYRAEPHPYLQSGERVRVRRGALEGIEGIFIRKKNVYRLVISVDILARSVAVEIDAADVEPLDSRRSTTERLMAGSVTRTVTPASLPSRTGQPSSRFDDVVFS